MRVFGKTLLHEFPMPYSHSEWYLPFSLGETVCKLGPKLRPSKSNQTKLIIIRKSIFVTFVLYRQIFQVVKYPGAGHLLEPPYVPFCELSYHKLVQGGMLWGGNCRDHCKAQVHSWHTMLAFVKEKLAPSANTSKL